MSLMSKTLELADNPICHEPSSMTSDLTNSVDFGEITEDPDEELLSTSAVLFYCKRKILHPYLRLLAVMGLRAPAPDPPEPRACRTLFGHMYLYFVVSLMCMGYVLQYMACFRRDRGFCYIVQITEDHDHICYGSVVFSYILPSILHFTAYIYALYMFRIHENEQLQNLMERVFLLSSNPSGGSIGQHRLVYTLWLFVGLSIVWMGLSLITVNVMMAQGTILFLWLEHSPTGISIPLKILLIISTLWHDMVQATIITSYCLQGQLLTAHLQFLKDKLLHHSIAPLDWIREIGEFRKLLKYLNEDLAPMVGIFTIVNISCAASGIAWLLKYDSVDKETVPIKGISILNVILWVLVSMVPFIQAARLTTACRSMQGIGHEVRGRPFVYQGTPGEDLDTILLYTSSLRMTSKLFRVPITGRYLCLALTLGAVVTLTLGQCHILE